MSQSTLLLAFHLNGLALSSSRWKGTSERAVRAVEITSLPKAPTVVLGVIDVEGDILPVLSIRYRFGFPEKAIGPDDEFLLAWTDGRRVALVIDQAQDVLEVAAEAILPTSNILPGLEHVQGVAMLDDGLVLIHDLKKFLSLDESSAL